MLFRDMNLITELKTKFNIDIIENEGIQHKKCSNIIFLVFILLFFISEKTRIKYSKLARFNSTYFTRFPQIFGF